MTFKETILRALISHGMSETQAATTLAMVVKENPDMLGRWEEDTSEYPDIMTTILWCSAKKCGLKLIEETCPNAWFKPMFTP